jgi:hypothetical protein
MKTFKQFVDHLVEKNVPTSPEKWARAKSAAKSKFDVYPSAYANGWASKKYKAMGGGWKSVSENHVAIAMGKELDDEGSMIMNQLNQMERSINMMRDVVKDEDMQVPAWVQSKVTLAADYIETAAGYMSSKNEEVEYLFDVIEEMVEAAAQEYNIDAELLWERLESVSDKELIDESAAWQRKAGKDPKGGLNRKGIASYRRENPGSKLSMAVTTPPSKLKPGSKAANRRKSFCARMGGMEGAMKKPNGEPTRKALALRKWNC